MVLYHKTIIIKNEKNFLMYLKVRITQREKEKESTREMEREMKREGGKERGREEDVQSAGSLSQMKLLLNLGLEYSMRIIGVQALGPFSTHCFLRNFSRELDRTARIQPALLYGF